MTKLGTFKHGDADHGPPRAARDALEAAIAAGKTNAELRHDSNTLTWELHEQAVAGPRAGQGEGLSPSGARGTTESELDAFAKKVARMVLDELKKGAP